jgi:hypothetical protein
MGWTDLHKAALVGNAERVKELLKKGANPNVQDEYGWTPLHEAALLGRVDVVKLLLEHGADPTVKDGRWKTPLDLAKAEGYHGVVSLIEEWLRRGKRRPQRREAAETRPWGGSQKAAPVSTAQPAPTQPLPRLTGLLPPRLLCLLMWCLWIGLRRRLCGMCRFLSLAPPSTCRSLGCLAVCFLDVAPSSAYTVAF